MALVCKLNLYNFWLFIPYLLARYKVFVREDGRLLFTEFDLQDFTSSHYVLLHQGHVIGTARVIYQANVAQIGRIAVIKKYRNQGYGKLLMRQLISMIQETHKTQTVSLLALEPNLVSFYMKLGFKEDGIVYLEQLPFIKMSKLLHN
ncbi:Putative N-acetyltransferase GCN5 [Candidatus Phycorickettsia trachydisci]|uniref:N-acetyltransferase GCN5 n=1 Tax=Candidatus Phycorickettsia trachydisci TaxID=2115978 RepID=A0A2P1PA43_9RICK|nr:GNAT family N-acetyltransferase [Candidatus Phycorickettsia trachydisci]AVP88137.1 Putative N-acetyltransferase GCN5 [Candidatus Phycorickettsia trachydisci]